MELYKLTAHQLAENLEKKEYSSRDIINSLEQRVRDQEARVKSYVRAGDNYSLNFKPAQAGPQSSLKGIPISIKDNICTEGLNTECCSGILAGFKPPYDATVIRRIFNAGGEVIATKTNMDEFAFGSSTENSCFGPTHNPWNLECVPGGSSGGPRL